MTRCTACGAHHAPDDPYRRSKTAEELAWGYEMHKAQQRYRWRCRAEDRDHRLARLRRLRGLAQEAA